MSRIAIVEKGKCNPVGCGNYLCMRLCPVNRAGKECIVEVDGKKAAINEELCTGCGICSKRCPFGAIHIINLPSEMKDEPIHRFGQNGFRLYSLPYPKEGKVTGIIGVNGIGKSTAIKVIAQVLKPNLGDYESEGSYDLLLERFKGTEAQNFFEAIKKGEIKIGYKPQQVSLIPKTTMGKVGNLLKRVDETNMFGEVVGKLDLGGVLETDVTKVSGGELQRVAIAATVLKKADLYIFDEPTSYLDIKQRLKIARFLRELVKTGKSVLVIEHDLIALDYMTDFIHIMYGKPVCYGVVSQKKASKAGINTFLSGFIKDENIRFRDHEIRFEIRPPAKSHQKEVLAEWPMIKKKMGDFELEVSAGQIKKKTIIGILGENGIGKTSFVKILAGIDKPDNTELERGLRVAYKPQYIENESDELVMEYLRDAIKKHHNDVIGPLGINELFMKKINELSGGELQRVEIARALAEDADLVLLDEPSAYLDVEQRLIVSKMIKSLVDVKGISILVVDHDLLFLDYVSDELIVFKGEPAVKGTTEGPLVMEEGMNSLLKEVNITLRREEESGRPRINKERSLKDREQKEKEKYYYS